MIRFNDNQPKRFQIRKRIIELIKEQNLKPGDKLPAEKDLMDLLNVSRLSLREALHILEEEHVVRVIHGLGWYLMSPSRTLETDISALFSVTDMFAYSGLELQTRVLSLKIVDLDDIREELGLKKKERIVAIERVRMCENMPYIYSIDYVPEKLFSREPKVEDFEGSILIAMEKTFRHRIEYTDARIQVVEQKDFESKDPIFTEITSWLMMEQVNYDLNGNPIIYSRDYHRSDKIKFYTRRFRKDLS